MIKRPKDFLIKPVNCVLVWMDTLTIKISSVKSVIQPVRHAQVHQFTSAKHANKADHWTPQISVYVDQTLLIRTINAYANNQTLF